MVRTAFNNRWLQWFSTVMICLAVWFSIKPEQSIDADGYRVWQFTDLNRVSETEHLVIYQGEFHGLGEQARFEKKGVRPHAFKDNASVTLLVRAYQLPDADYFIHQTHYLIQSWQKAGVRVKGLQIDYDSPSAKLQQYRRFLSTISSQFDRAFISITGLSSWLSDNLTELNRFSATLKRKKNKVQEIISVIVKAVRMRDFVSSNS